MTPEQLLKECEQLPYQKRIQRMVDLGRVAEQNADVRETIAMLARGNTYERLLAVQTCYGSRDATLALQGLYDASRRVRGRSIAIVALYADDGDLQNALESISRDMRTALLYRLLRRLRQEPVDTYIHTLAARQDKELQRYIALGSAEIVRQHIKQISAQLELRYWSRLAHHHPEIVVEQLVALTGDTYGSTVRELTRAEICVLGARSFC